MTYDSFIQDKKYKAYFDDNYWQTFLFAVSPQFHQDQVFQDIFTDTFDLYNVTVSLVCDNQVLLIEGTTYNVEKSCAQCQESYQYFAFKESNQESEFFSILCTGSDKLKELGKKVNLHFYG